MITILYNLQVLIYSKLHEKNQVIKCIQDSLSNYAEAKHAHQLQI